jgi:molybdenum cofactor cytidylyltransferase
MPEPRVGVAALLLASGRGSRFDATGRLNKLCQLLPDGRPVIAASAANLLAAGLSVTVVAPSDPRLASALAALELNWCENLEPDRGMGHSIALGVSSTAHAAGWLIALADMPYISPHTIAQVAMAIQTVAIAAPCYRGERGHPVAFSTAMKQSLEDLDGDAGARSVLQDRLVTLVETDDCGILRDIDRPQDLQQ